MALRAPQPSEARKQKKNYCQGVVAGLEGHLRIQFLKRFWVWYEAHMITSKSSDQRKVGWECRLARARVL